MSEFWRNMQSGHKVIVLAMVIGVPVLIWKLEEFEVGMRWVVELARVLVQQAVSTAQGVL